MNNVLKDVDRIVHLAGILFKHNPKKFLAVTNTVYFKNLLETAFEYKVKRVILISFSHVEGATTPENSSTGNLNGSPVSMHAKTRLEEEKIVLETAKESNFEPVSLRVCMI